MCVGPWHSDASPAQSFVFLHSVKSILSLLKQCQLFVNIFIYEFIHNIIWANIHIGIVEAMLFPPLETPLIRRSARE